MASIDWKWLIIGLVLGWMVVPRLQVALFARHAAPAKAA